MRTTTPRRLLQLAVLALASAVLTPAGDAQTASPSPMTPPVSSPPAQVPDRHAVSATISGGSNAPADIPHHRHWFEEVMLQPGQTITVVLHFGANMVGESLSVEAPDGGEITVPPGKSQAVGTDRSMMFHYTAGTLPGRSRVIVHGFDALDMLNFWVADPNDPNNNGEAPAGGQQ